MQGKHMTYYLSKPGALFLKDYSAIVRILQRGFKFHKTLFGEFSNNCVFFKSYKTKSTIKCFQQNFTSSETKYQHSSCMQFNRCLHRPNSELWVYIFTFWNWIAAKEGCISDQVFFFLNKFIPFHMNDVKIKFNEVPTYCNRNQKCSHNGDPNLHWESF